ncbi:hypothetical protein CONCODRAFT_83534 [Conidiobolus coronatus NRRL 28638]|uniref:t-SNARE coiled-coil homology domain-containing protein n=1 Tax=Conidiobolus coronatus (strain ATCC 28846 / CBS 209.66 / NRRL 28638) TaxID=796925 RepID=A0A137PEG5_CONC2|nr:hypothetical protein CONCODRAFT_83534 [Conidiobolus coronatus NRRL 28638]|eukprot:KXN73396.1 hypothetical protein CONCODRAFT_83534 [Conidiobolus coronatus NRRL 28638]
MSNRGRNNFGSDADIYQSQNDRRLEEMASQATALHRVTIDIHDEVGSQNRLLDDTDNQMDNFGTNLSRTSNKLTSVVKSPRTKLLLLTILVIDGTFFILYYLGRFFWSLLSSGGNNNTDPIPNE